MKWKKKRNKISAPTNARKTIQIEQIFEDTSIFKFLFYVLIRTFLIHIISSQIGFTFSLIKCIHAYIQGMVYPLSTPYHFKSSTCFVNKHLLYNQREVKRAKFFMKFVLNRWDIPFLLDALPAISYKDCIYIQRIEQRERSNVNYIKWIGK